MRRHWQRDPGAQENNPVSVLSPHRTGIWRQAHYLDRMTFRELVVAYFQYYAIRAYLGLAVVAFAAAAFIPPTLVGGISSALAAVFLYPLIWYLLHRFVLHGRWMWRFPFLARTWKRIHYDHHQDPNHLEVLFGALHTTLPAIAAATLPVGYLIGGPGAALIAFAAGLLTTCFYEFAHCVQHLSYKPRNRWFAAMKRRHMAHHFHDERGNFGITSFWPDRLFGTLYEREERPSKSKTVFNLGYTEDVALRFPWVARLSGGVATGHPRRRGTHDDRPRSAPQPGAPADAA
jgi:sterol desaturase/sphingolipid hydroxylase (fatty acid hydroxylase superfamily)